MIYSTSDSRLAAHLLVRGCELTGTETRYVGDDDRVHLQFNVDDEKITALKREFFENGQVPALEFANAMKQVMYLVRQAREMSREAR